MLYSVRTQLWEDRKAEDFAAEEFGGREVALPVPQFPKALLPVERHGVVDVGPDAIRSQVLLQFVAPLSTNT